MTDYAEPKAQSTIEKHAKENLRECTKKQRTSRKTENKSKGKTSETSEVLEENEPNPATFADTAKFKEK